MFSFIEILWTKVTNIKSVVQDLYTGERLMYLRRQTSGLQFDVMTHPLCSCSETRLVLGPWVWQISGLGVENCSIHQELTDRLLQTAAFTCLPELCVFHPLCTFSLDPFSVFVLVNSYLIVVKMVNINNFGCASGLKHCGLLNCNFKVDFYSRLTKTAA